MTNITWFKKDRDTTHSDADVSITLFKKATNGASIIIRNGYREEIAPDTDYIMVGVPADDTNRLVFMASDKANGWKLYKRRNADSIYFTMITGERMRDLCARFAGNYQMELYEDKGATLYCINRRNVL